MRWLEASSPPPLPPDPNLRPLVARLLARRGLTTPEAVRAFLDPAAYRPAPPSALPGLPIAVERITEAIRQKKPIGVWGDFDVDGQTATTILVEALRTLGAETAYYIPVRSTESHGISLPRLEQMIDQGIRLIVTCDTGISAHEAVSLAHARGAEMIITDHHELPASIPRAGAVINPKMLPDKHPLSTLSGAGVAYKLAEALLDDRLAEAEALLDLTALGLVADLAVLTGETRYLTQKGLTALRATNRPGLKVMYKLAELDTSALNESHIGFTIAPRLNALGRLGDANAAVEFLTTRDPVRARVLAVQMENYNAQRQLLTNQVTMAAEAQLRANPSLLAAPVIIVGHPEWPGGVVGIAAARLVERYEKPAIVLVTPPGKPAYGSARSVEGLNITAAIAEQQDLLLKFGGHPMAAGLSIAPENLPAFIRRMNATVGKMQQSREEPVLEIEAWLNLSDLTDGLAAALEPLAPFGPGNPRPIFASRGLTLKSAVPLGRNKEHRKLIVSDEQGISREALWWDGGAEELPAGVFDLAYTVRAANWRGKPQVQLEIVSLCIAEKEQVEIKTKTFEVVDYRAEPDTFKVLERLKQEPSTLVWAEGEAKERVGGADRHSLRQARHLVIWSIPPSGEELRAALEAVRPQTVSLLAVQPPPESAEGFIARLSGLVKFVIKQRGGVTSYEELAAATGHRVLTVKRGLTWLLMQGKISLERDEDGQLLIREGKNEREAAGARRMWSEVQSLLAETNAYRAHFCKADKDNLFA